MRKLLSPAASLALASLPVSLTAQDKPVFHPDGTISVPAFELPPSELASPEARAAQADRSKSTMATPPSDIPVDAIRQGLEAMLAPQVEAMKRVYPVTIADTTIAGVPGRVITPGSGTFDKKRVLINLHGGGFTMCATACALLESIPVASLGGYKVVTVDYRQAPEHRHPAALEDIEKVYRALLKRYKPQSIGIYGCSAGGSLSAQTAAWLPSRGLPQPGAIGIFGAGAVRFFSGDSAHIAAYVDGSFPPPPKPGQHGADITRGYFSEVSMDDPVVSPALHPDVVAKFPPTLIITGTRAMDLSPAVVTNSALLNAGVQSTLIVGEGMGHCYIYQPDMPEARDAHQATVDFFRKHLR